MSTRFTMPFGIVFGISSGEFCMAWERIRGHDANVVKLRAAFERGRLAHAYLFVGPDGIGKRLFAEEFAKALLCERPSSSLVACDRCPSCQQISAGSHPDITHAAKPEDKLELPIDVVRTFCMQLGLKPSRGMRKVAILQDADAFNDESANCFLKTLEEPPPGSVLILLANSTEQQLPTILSRVQILRFDPLSVDELERVLTQHEIGDADAIARLARISDGSVGVALSLADADLGAFRSQLLNALIQPRPDSPGLAKDWLRFTEEAGKDGAAQRGRVSAVLRLLLAQLRTALRLALGSATDELDPVERCQLQRLAEVHGADGLLPKLDAAIEAARYIDRRVQIALILEKLADELCAISKSQN